MKKETIFILLFFLAAVCIFFYPVFKRNVPFPGDLLVGNYLPYSENTYGPYGPGAVPHKAQGIDVVRQLFPWKYFAIDTLKNGQIPFWDPYNFSGNLLLANFQSGTFYPLNLFFFVFHFVDAWTIYIFLIPFFSCFFTYLFLQELTLSKKASVFGGIVFAFSSYMVFWLEWGNIGHTLLWLPLTLFLVERLRKNLSFLYTFFLALVLSMSLLAGYIQGYFYMILVLLFYFFVKEFWEKTLSIKHFATFLIAIFLPILFTLFQTLPTLELFKNSARGSYSIDQIMDMLNPIQYLITLFVPNFFGNPATRNFWFPGTYIERTAYIGLVPLLLALYAIFSMKYAESKYKKNIAIFASLTFLSLFLATNFFVNKFFYLIPFPIISTTVPVRILSIFVFSTAILSAYGLDLLLTKANRKRLLLILFFTFVIFSCSWFFVFLAAKLLVNQSWTANLSVTKRNLILPTALFFAFSLFTCFPFFAKRKTIVIIGLFSLTFLDLFSFFHKITPFSPKAYTYPTTALFSYFKTNGGIDRFWGYGSGYIDTNFQTYEKIFSTDGYDPLFIKRYGELLSSSKDGSTANLIKRSDANIQGGYGKDDLRGNYYRQRILNLLGVKYLINKVVPNTAADYQTFPKEIYTLLWQNGVWQIYENKQTLPRVFLAASSQVESDKKGIIDKLFDKNVDLSKTIILEEDLPRSISLKDDPKAHVSIEQYKPNEVMLQTNTTSSMLLFLSDNYYPGWNVDIDGRNDKIYRADYTFRAVVVPAGQHRVRFTYFPKSFSWGVKLSIVSIILFFVFWFMIAMDKRYHGKK